MYSPKILKNSIINYSLGDSFIMPVTNDEPYNDDDKLTFVVSENETSEPAVEKTFSPAGGVFTVNLSKASLAALPVGVYLYKIIITDIYGNTVTQKSGNFYVNWGA